MRKEHGWSRCDRYEKWDKLIEDTEKSLGEDNGYEKTI